MDIETVLPQSSATSVTKTKGSRVKFAHVVGCRPNFVKVAACFPALGGVILHTNQHYDYGMSGVFFETLQLPEPVGNLDALETIRPEWVIVYGDARSTLEGAVAAKHRGLKLAHIEAGLRCGDLDMPEEVNRRCVDLLADVLFAPSEDAMMNLAHEGLDHKAHFVGNVMIDTLARMRPRYGVVTLHRPVNVDNVARLGGIIKCLSNLPLNLIFPAHPRTRRIAAKNIEYRDPLPYDEFVELMAGAALVITDSGGIQEESTYLGVPCFTLRSSTERPITVLEGTNQVITDLADLNPEICKVLGMPKLWDGRAAERIGEILNRSSESENAGAQEEPSTESANVRSVRRVPPISGAA